MDSCDMTAAWIYVTKGLKECPDCKELQYFEKLLNRKTPVKAVEYIKDGKTIYCCPECGMKAVNKLKGFGKKKCYCTQCGQNLLG